MTMRTEGAEVPRALFQRICHAVNYLFWSGELPPCMHYRVAQHRSTGKFVVIFWCNGSSDHNPEENYKSHEPWADEAHLASDIIADGESEAKKMGSELSPLLARPAFIQVPKKLKS